MGRGAEHTEINALSTDGKLGKTSHRQPHSRYARMINGFFFQSEKGGKGFLGRGMSVNQLREPEYM